MRIGAIFARGSCRALKWMALVGMVFALGTGAALAQVTITVPQTGVGDATAVARTVAVTEASARVTVRVTVNVAANAPADSAFAVQLTLRAPATTAYPPDLVGELTATDADVYWETTGRGTAASGVLTLSWGQRPHAQVVTGDVILGTFQDDDAEDEHYDLGVDFSTTANGGSVSGSIDWTHTGQPLVRMTDNETQRYVLRHPLSTSSSTNEGVNVEGIRFEPVPAKTAPFPIRVNLASENDTSDYSLTNNAGNAISQELVVELPTGVVGQNAEFNLNTLSNDGDRADDTVTLTAYLRQGDPAVDPPQGNTKANISQPVATLEISVIDQHKLPDVVLTELITPSSITTHPLEDGSVEEGTKKTLTLAVDRGTATDAVPDYEKVTVKLENDATSAADHPEDYQLTSYTVSFPAGNGVTTGKTTLEAQPDEDVGEEVVVLKATVSGEAMYGSETEEMTLSPITIVDRTLKKIYPESIEDIDNAVMDARAEGAGDNGLWNAGETLTLMAAELFDWPETTTSVVLGNVVFSDPEVLSASASNDRLTLTAVSDGTTDVSVTGTVVGEASSVTTTSQTVSNVATVTFSLMVDSPMITAKGGEQGVADAAIKVAAEASPNGIWEPESNGGAMAMIELSDLFDVPDSINDDYVVRSSDRTFVSVAISADATMVELTPKGAGMATITVTAIDTDRPGNAVSIDFTATVVEQAAIRGLDDKVSGVFMAAGADDLVAQGPAISLDMSELFEVRPGVTPTYSADSSDADVLMASASGTMLTLTPGQGVAGGPATITVTALDRASGANDSVEYMAMVDALPAMLTITSDPMDMVEEGGSITVTAMLNQKAAGDMIIPVEVTGPATPAETNILLMEGMDEASVMLMASNDYDPMSDWNDIVIVASHSAIEGGAAVMTLSVTENDSEITYTLAGPEDMNLVEGSEYELTVTAEPAAPMDTEVTIMRDRANSDADADDYTVEPITIMAGETSGSTMLMVTEDNMDDSGHASPEMLTLFGMVGNMQTNSVSVYLWDMAVPALPIIAQLLLAAFLAIGGYRRYLRR